VGFSVFACPWALRKGEALPAEMFGAVLEITGHWQDSE